MLVLTILGFALIEGTGLAQQQAGKLSVASDRPSMIDSFLDNPVNSTDELVAVLQKSKKLRERYAKHFNMPEDRIVDFVKNSLVVDRLKRDRVVNNYCITPKGRIYSLRQIFPKGTRVWALRDGTPILRWACANPLAKRLPMTLTSRRPKLSPLPEVAGQRPHVVETTPMPQLPEVAAVAPALPVEETIAANTENLVVPTMVTGSATAITGGIPIPGRIPLVPLTAITLPWIGVIHRPTPPGIVVTPQVPEPGSLLLVASGLPVVALLRSRRRRAGR